MNTRLKAPLKQWLKFLGVALIILFFTVWMSRLWILLLLLPALDIYVTRFVNWGWWKEIKNPSIRKIFEWADAIIFALIAVYIINLYFFQNYKIPSSSLEKTLLVGDHLFVSKVAYGPRTPNTPLSFPLVQHTFPIINCKSYIESIQWKSRRLAGMGEVQRNDIVVFNFPAGDTVAINRQAEDYEGLCYKAGLNRLKSNGNNPDSLRAKGVDVRTLCLTVGRDIIKNDKGQFGDITYRPVDRRENYVKRCVGLPGDSLQIIERELYINGEKQVRPEGVQHFCVIISSKKFEQDFYDEFQISKENWSRGFAGVDQAGNYNYVFPLTLKNQEDMRKLPFIKSVVEHNANDFFLADALFPVGYNSTWTVDNYGPIYIPKGGTTVEIDKNNIALYERIIRNYEGNKLEIKNDGIYINDQKSDSYTFRMNYFWMMGDNRHNSADSRMWGFVPEDHVVGKPLFVWLSLNPDKGIFNGGIRWNRFFKYAGK
jgi:signal peptidase I